MCEWILWCALFRVLLPFSVADSKTLNEEQREKLFEMINTAEYLGWKVEILSPTHISNSMLQR